MPSEHGYIALVPPLPPKNLELTVDAQRLILSVLLERFYLRRAFVLFTVESNHPHPSALNMRSVKREEEKKGGMMMIPKNEDHRRSVSTLKRKEKTRSSGMVYLTVHPFFWGKPGMGFEKNVMHKRKTKKRKERNSL